MSRGDKEQGAEGRGGTDLEQSSRGAGDIRTQQAPSSLCASCSSSFTCEETTIHARHEAAFENLTLRVRGAADHVGQFGFQAGGGGAVLARVFHAARPHRHHALQRRVGPQTLGLVDRQRRGVVDQEASVLRAENKRRGVLDEVFYSKTWKNTVNCCSKAFLDLNHQWQEKFQDHLSEQRERIYEFRPRWL